MDKFEKLASEGPVDPEKLLHEEEILDDEDKEKPFPGPVKSDRVKEEKPKKPCSGCTCGWAEELEKDVQEKAREAKSTCGSCYLGDAFRCGRCPYLGTPAFEPGEKVTIDTSDDAL